MNEKIDANSGFLQKISGAVSKLPPRTILGIALGAGALFLLIYFIFDYDMYRDVAGCYAWYGRKFGRGVWDSEVIAGLPPLNIFLIGLLVKLGCAGYFSAMLVSGIFYLLTIFPLYGMLCRFVSSRCAAWGCLLFAFAPKVIRFAGKGLLESGRDFFLVLSLCLLFRISDGGKRWKETIGLGVALALLSLSRGEGIIFAGVIWLALPVISLWRSRQMNAGRSQAVRCALGRWLLCSLFFCLVISPRLAETYRITGYPVIDSRMTRIIKAIPGSDRLFTSKLGDKDPLAASDYKGEPGDTVLTKMSGFVKNMLRGAYEFYFVFALAGIVSAVYRRRWRMEYWVFLAVTAAVFPLYFALFHPYRYFIFLIPLFMVFTLDGIKLFFSFAERYGKLALALSAVGLLVVLQTHNAVTFPFDGGKDAFIAGNWLRENKTLFIPETEKGRKLIVADVKTSEVTYWCDEDRLLEYGDRRFTLGNMTGFDVLTAINGKKEAAFLRKREDLREISCPGQKRYTLFVPVRREK